MLIKQLFDPESCTYTYLIADPQSREAIIIDPVREQVDRDLRIINELGVGLLYVLETHVHADHVTGSSLLKSQTGAKSGVAKVAEVSCADLHLEHGDSLSFGEYRLQVRATPGHTDGCLTYVLETNGEMYAFTGDTLFIRGCGRTDFQNGSSKRLYESVHTQIYTLPEATNIFPGHDYNGRKITTVAQEKEKNPRLNLNVEKDVFIQIMKELKLKKPKKMQMAVPANLNCGQSLVDKVKGGKSIIEEDYRGLNPLMEYRIIDVRSLREFNGPLGHINGAELVPLETVGESSKTWSKAEAILLVCRSGQRSARAYTLLQALGFDNLTNLKGGMKKWVETHPVNGQGLRA